MATTTAAPPSQASTSQHQHSSHDEGIHYCVIRLLLNWIDTNWTDDTKHFNGWEVRDDTEGARLLPSLWMNFCRMRKRICRTNSKATKQTTKKKGKKNKKRSDILWIRPFAFWACRFLFFAKEMEKKFRNFRKEMIFCQPFLHLLKLCCLPMPSLQCTIYILNGEWQVPAPSCYPIHLNDIVIFLSMYIFVRD